MTINELIEYINSHITNDIVEEFNNIFLFDHHDDRSDNINKCRIDYYSFLGLYKRYHGETSNIFISELKEKGYLSVDSSETKISEIRLALTNLKRSILLQKSNISNDSSFEEKLNFSLEFPEYFRIFREYEIPNFGRFSCFTETPDDINYLIQEFDSLLSKYRVRNRSFSSLEPITLNQLNFVINANKFTYKYVINDHFSNIDNIYYSNDTSAFVKLSYFVLNKLSEHNFDLLEFLKTANRPIISFLILKYKSYISDVIQYNSYLLNFDWDADEENILTLQTQYINIISTDNYPYNFTDIFFDNNILCIYYNNNNRFNFLTKIKENKIFRQDMILIDVIIKNTIYELDTMNFLDNNLIECLIKDIESEVNKFITPDLKRLFFTHFLNAFSKDEILNLNQDIWEEFKSLWIKIRKLNLDQNTDIETNQTNSNNYESEIKRSSYTTIQLEILNILSDRLTLLIELKIDDHRSKERLSFSACTSEAEKIKYIKKEIKKYQDIISKCPPNIAEFCHAYLVTLTIFDGRLSGDEMNQICSNFIQEEFYELLTDVNEDFPTIEDVNKMDDSFWESFLLYENEDDDGVSVRKNVKSFIKFMALTDRNLTFKEIIIDIEDGQKKEILILDTKKRDLPLNDLNSNDSTNQSKNKSVKPSRSKMYNSFTYKKLATNSENLLKLMNFLKTKKFIGQETSIIEFKAVFSNNDILNKVKWTGNISELAYFIKYLHNETKKVVNTKQKQWHITINCFVIPSDPLPITNSRLRQQKTPSSIALIETAVNLL